MSKHKHTEGPWERDGLMVKSESGTYVGYLEDFSDADAERVIACVNACIDCPTEKIKTAKIDFMTCGNNTYGIRVVQLDLEKEAMCAQNLLECMKQRDELLSALDSILQHPMDERNWVAARLLRKKHIQGETCALCGGSGKLDGESCFNCEGTGKL